MFADLHLHTHFSDGTYSPEELAGHGKRVGLAAMALTDHDTVEGCTRMAAACANLGIEFIPGTELTAEIKGEEVHILGFYLDITHAALLREMEKFQQVRQDRIREMVERLNRLNILITAEQVLALANCRAPGRPHVGRALVAAGYCSSQDEAFDRFLKKHRPAWVPKFKMSAPDAIALIHDAGGLAVMAHPGLGHDDKIIPDLKAAGLDGLECYHSKHSASTVTHYLAMADHYGLLVSGGSDCHGLSKGRPLVGSIQLPYGRVEKLRERWLQRHAGSTPTSGL